jgi:hypothetical protein
MSEPTMTTERRTRLIHFALWRLAQDAHARAVAAAQDPKAFPAGAAEKFLQDAKDAEALLPEFRINKEAA